MYKFLAGMIVMATIAAFASRPSLDDTNAEIRAQLAKSLTEIRLNSLQGLDAAALLACRVDPNTCIKLIASGFDVQYENRHLYAKIDVSGFDMQARCYGVYTRFFCPGGLTRQ